jgi:UDP-glucuronate 4-epimerase
VIGIDNFNDYYDIQLKYMRSNYLRIQHNITIVNGDLCDDQLVSSLFDLYQFTHVIHLAAQAGVRYSVQNPQAYVTANILCSVKLLEHLRKKTDRTVPFIYASSSSVYGKNKQIPFSVEHQVNNPSNMYGMTKIALENMATVYNQLYNIPVVGMRFFTVYGTFGRPDMALFNWTDAMAHKKSFNVYYKNGETIKRDFTHISDISAGIISIMNIQHELSNNQPLLFNLGNNKPESIERLLQILRQSTGLNTIVNKVKLPDVDMVATAADIDLSKRKLNFKPKTTLMDGVNEFTKWYRQTFWPENIVLSTLSAEDPWQEPDLIEDYYISLHSHKIHGTILCDSSIPEEYINTLVSPYVRLIQSVNDTSLERSSNSERYCAYLNFLRNQLSYDWKPKNVLLTDLFRSPWTHNPFEKINMGNKVYLGPAENAISDSSSCDLIRKFGYVAGKIETIVGLLEELCSAINTGKCTDNYVNSLLENKSQDVS